MDRDCGVTRHGKLKVTNKYQYLVNCRCNPHSLPEQELAICKQLGVDPDDYLAVSLSPAHEISVQYPGLSDTESAVCKVLDITATDYLKTKSGSI